MLSVVALTLGSLSMPPEELISIARARVDALGTYRLRFTKEELVDGEWIGPQVMQLVIREKPYAVTGVVVSGPNKGRRFEYDEQKRPGSVQVREAGLLGAIPIWLDINNPLTRKDTRHPVNELGYGFVLRMIERDEKLSRVAGGFTRVEDGPGCLMLTAPPGVAGLYAQRVRLCFDTRSQLLTSLDIWDAKGTAIEKLKFELL